MKRMGWMAMAAMGLAMAGGTAFAVTVGSQAPNFTGTDSHGKAEKLSDYKGKYVVLEWTNSDCPFAKAQYTSGHMEGLQKEWTAKGVVWLTILSSGHGQQGYKTAAEENSYMAEMKSMPTAAILDPSGAIGHEYEAKTTPHMFVIDPSGKVIYEGAIDDHPSSNPDEVKDSKSYVSAALTSAMAGKAVPVPFTRPYGCNVKYSGE